MQIVIFPAEGRKKAVYSIDTPEVDYSKCISNYNSFVHVARYEEYTWILIMDLFNEEYVQEWKSKGKSIENWKDMAVYDESDNTEQFMLPEDTRSLIDRVSSNYLLIKHFPQVKDMQMPAIKELLHPLYIKMKNSTALADIYSQDHYDLAHNTRNPIVLFEDGKYIGHIYLLGLTSKSKYGNFIGIRESISNMINKVYNSTGCSNVGFKLLYGCYTYVSKYLPNVQYLQLEAPIGPMPKIAKRFGFEDGESYNMKNIPSITYEQSISIIH